MFLRMLHCSSDGKDIIAIHSKRSNSISRSTRCDAISCVLFCRRGGNCESIVANNKAWRCESDSISLLRLKILTLQGISRSPPYSCQRARLLHLLHLLQNSTLQRCFYGVEFVSKRTLHRPLVVSESLVVSLLCENGVPLTRSVLAFDEHDLNHQ